MKPNQITKQHHRTKEQIQAEYGEWLKPIADELKIFGGYSGLSITDLTSMSCVYSWDRKEQFIEPTNLLPKDREPHKWTDKEDVCLKK